MQREVDVVVGSAGCPEVEQAPTVSKAVGNAPEVMVALPDFRRARSTEDLSQPRFGLAQHERAVRLHDPRLLGGDVGERRADRLGVVEADVGDHCDLTVGHVGGVPPAAEAHLDDADIDGDVGKPPEGSGRQDLEDCRCVAHHAFD